MARPGISRDSRGIESFEAVAEAIPHIVWLAAADGSTDYVNEMATSYTGVPRQDTYGWRWLGVVHPGDTGRARLGWQHATRSVMPYSLSYRIRRHDGRFGWHDDLLGLSLRSIETSRARLRQRLGLRTRADLVRFAREVGWADGAVGSE